MRNVILRLGVLIGVALAPLSSFAQPNMSEVHDCMGKMLAIQRDLVDLAKYSRGVDQDAAIRLCDVADSTTTKIGHLEDLLLIVTLIRNDDDRNNVKKVVDDSMKYFAKGIDLSLKKVNLEISHARSNAIVSTGNQMKTELRRLHVLLLSPMKIPQ